MRKLSKAERLSWKWEFCRTRHGVQRLIDFDYLYPTCETLSASFLVAGCDRHFSFTSHKCQGGCSHAGDFRGPHGSTARLEAARRAQGNFPFLFVQLANF